MNGKKYYLDLFKIVVLFLGIFLGTIISLLLLVFFVLSITLKGGIESRKFYSPSKNNMITVLLQSSIGSEHHDYIYIIGGSYNKKEMPKEKIYIKFPECTAIMIEWTNDKKCNIICDQIPEINNLITNGYQVNVVLDENKIRSMMKTDKVILYKLYP